MATPKIHYAGTVRTPRLKILGGYAACCSGNKAEIIWIAGHNTQDPAQVTCEACKRMMAKDKSIPTKWPSERNT